MVNKRILCSFVKFKWRSNMKNTCFISVCFCTVASDGFL